MDELENDPFFRQRWTVNVAAMLYHAGPDMGYFQRWCAIKQATYVAKVHGWKRDAGVVVGGGRRFGGDK